MHKIIFYQWNEPYDKQLSPDIIQNLFDNFHLESCQKQLEIVLKKQNIPVILQQCKKLCHDLEKLTVAENVIHLIVGEEIFEQMIFYEHYICYEYDNPHQILFKKCNSLLSQYQQLSEDKNLITV